MLLQGAEVFQRVLLGLFAFFGEGGEFGLLGRVFEDFEHARDAVAHYEVELVFGDEELSCEFNLLLQVGGGGPSHLVLPD